MDLIFGCGFTYYFYLCNQPRPKKNRPWTLTISPLIFCFFNTMCDNFHECQFDHMYTSGKSTDTPFTHYDKHIMVKVVCCFGVLGVTNQATLLLILPDRPPCPHIMIIIGWWYSSPEQGLQGHQAIYIYFVKLLISNPLPHSHPIVSSCATPYSSLFASSPSDSTGALSFDPSKYNPS